MKLKTAQCSLCCQDTDEAENVEDGRPPGHDEELLEAQPPLMDSANHLAGPEEEDGEQGGLLGDQGSPDMIAKESTIKAPEDELCSDCE